MSTCLTIRYTSIGVGAFRDNQLTSVTIPTSVTSIKWKAFAENQLTGITIPNSVTEIRVEAFAENQLTSVTIPKSVTSIGHMAFRDNKLTSVTIGENVELGAIEKGKKYDAFPDGFDDFYQAQGRKAGTYTLVNGKWTVR